MILRTGLWLGILATLLLGAPPTQAQGRRTCPADGAPLEAPPAGTWNTSGGVDSDGCRYAVDRDGQWRVVGLRQVIPCRSCGLTFPPGRPAGRLEPAAVARVRSALAPLPPPTAARPPLAARHEAAAKAARALGPAGLGFRRAHRADALVGELYLRAAWAVRGSAVLDPPVKAYRPHDLAAGLRTLRELEERAAWDRDVASPLEAMLAELDGARTALEQVEAPDAGSHLALEEARVELMRLERTILELRAEESDAARAGRADASRAHLDLIRSWLRYGDAAERARWIGRARDRYGRRLESELSALEAAAAEEARLLGLAGEAFAAAAAGAPAGGERARLHFLAGDTARRRGADERARRHFEEAVELAPQEAAGERAGFLLEAEGGG